MTNDIALGLQDQEDEEEALAAFAKAVNASWMREWSDLGFYEEGEFAGWGAAFYRVLEITKARGGRIHFNMTGLDIQDALAGDPETWAGRYTAWELQQILLRQDFFDMTEFYLNGRRITTDEAEKLGIVRPMASIDGSE